MSLVTTLGPQPTDQPMKTHISFRNPELYFALAYLSKYDAVLVTLMAFCFPVSLVFVMTALIPKPRVLLKPNLHVLDLIHDSVKYS